MGETVEISGEIKRETELAVLFFDGEKEVWLPRSQITITKQEDGVEIGIPRWLAEETELV